MSDILDQSQVDQLFNSIFGQDVSSAFLDPKTLKQEIDESWLDSPSFWCPRCKNPTKRVRFPREHSQTFEVISDRGFKLATWTIPGNALVCLKCAKIYRKK